MIQSIIRGNDGIQLKSIEYPAMESRAIVICVHGMAEHQMRYQRLAHFLNENNFTTITYDHRGHGESLLKEGLGYQGKNGFNKMVDNLDTIVNEQIKNHPDKKIFLLGHSMGSFVVQRYIQQHNKVSGVILTGSSYKQFGMRLLKMLGVLLCQFGGAKRKGKWMNQVVFGTFNKPFKPSRTNFDWLNRKKSEVDLYVEDEKCGFVLSNQFYYDFISGLIVVQNVKNIQKVSIELPILILAGGTDPVGKYGKRVKELYYAYSKSNPNVDMKLYKGARHEILLEENYNEVYLDILTWIENINK